VAYDKVYYASNKESSNLRSKQYRQTNKEYFAMKAMERKATKLKATPSWLSEDDKARIRYIYELSRDAYLLTGDEYNVDHIVPLQSKSVCGLHVPWNLQVLSKFENQSKSNKF